MTASVQRRNNSISGYFGLDRISGIYQITCIPENKSYIGSSNNVWRRLSTHFFHLRAGDHGNKPLQAAFDEYGLASFRYGILTEVPSNKIKDAESEWVDRYGLSNLYNVNAVSPTKITQVDRFINFINKRWLLPSSSGVGLSQLYKIWREDDKQEITALAKDCCLLDTQLSRVSFISVIKLMCEKLGYQIEGGQSRFGGARHTYKLIIAYDPAASTYIPPYPAPSSTPTPNNH